MDMLKIFSYFVLEAERLLGALLPVPQGVPHPAPEGFHIHYPLPLEVLGLKILRSTIIPAQLLVYYPITTRPIYSHFE